MHWDSLRQDFLYTLRAFRRDAGFFAAAVLIIGLGIGANTAMFSVVNAILFRPLQFQSADRLVWIANSQNGQTDLSSVTTRVANYLDWRSLNRSFEDLTAYFAFFDYGTYNLVGSGEPDRLVGVGVSQNFLSFLGIKPMLGRSFTEEECKWNAPQAVILTRGLWERRFGADPHIIGRAITLNDKSATIVGVLPESFDFSTVFTPGSRIDMLVPFPITPETDRYGNTLAVIGRLKHGVTVQQARADFDVINEQMRRAHPDRWTFGAKLTPLQEQITGRYRRGLLLLLCAVAAVLLIACTNLSNLLLARATSRRREVAIRSALGATRSRLVRQMLTESLMLSACGALVGLAVAWLAVRGLSNIKSVGIPLLQTAGLDASALLFTIIAAAATGLLFGIVPAWQASASQQSESLKDTGRGLSEGRHTLSARSTLVVLEVAVACVLLVGAGLLIRSFIRVLDVDLGFQPERAAAWRIETGQKYPAAGQRYAFYDRLVRSIQAIPGVESAGVTDALPLSRDRSWGIGVRGVTYPRDQYPIGHPRIVDWRYITTMKIPLISGRLFNERDTAESEKVIILNEKAAQRLFPGQNAIGGIVRVNGESHVVGIAGNVRHQSVEEEAGLEFYLPLTQMTMSSVELVVRTRIDPAALAPSIRTALRELDPSLPTAEFRPLQGLVEHAVSPRRFLVLLLGGFALAALILASVGIFGVVSYNVRQRTREIGIRMALGASAAQVQGQVIRQTISLVSLGIIIGVGAALALARLAASLLYQLEPTDPPTFATTVGVLLIVAVSAGYLPALRASRVDPMAALRTE